MTPMPTQRLLLPQRQPRVPRPGPHPLVPFARGGGFDAAEAARKGALVPFARGGGVGGGGVPAWRGTPPAPAPARATAGIARASALADAWDTGIAAPAHPINTADPPAASAPPVVSPLACGADLRRGMRAHATGARGTPLIGALASSCGACASAIGARGNRTGSGCGAGPAARGRPTRRSWR